MQHSVTTCRRALQDESQVPPLWKPGAVTPAKRVALIGPYRKPRPRFGLPDSADIISSQRRLTGELAGPQASKA